MQELEVKEVFLSCDKESWKPWTSEDIWGLFQALREKKSLDKDQERLLILIRCGGLRLQVKKEQKKEKNFQEMIHMLSQLKALGVIPSFQVIDA